MRIARLLVFISVTVGAAAPAFADDYASSGAVCRESPADYTGNATWNVNSVGNTGASVVKVICPFVQEMSSNYITQLQIRKCTAGAASLTFNYHYKNWAGEYLYFDTDTNGGYACMTFTDVPAGAYAYSGEVDSELGAPIGGVLYQIMSYVVSD